MTLIAHKVKVLTSILQDTINQGYGMEVGLELKRRMLIMLAASPDAPKIQEAIAKEEYALEQQKKVMDILYEKLEKAEKENV